MDEKRNLSDSIAEKHLAEAAGATFFGRPVLELSRDDLIVMAVMGWAKVKQMQEDRIRPVF